MASSNPPALITGGAGAIGSVLTRTLARSREVIVVDDLSSGHRFNLVGIQNLNFIEGSIVDDAVLDLAFSLRPECVFHLAANFANQNSVDNPRKDLDVNGCGTLLVLEHAVRAGCRKVVYASSSCVYGHSGEEMVEEKIGELDTPYAITKLLGEHYARFFHAHHGLDVTILRFFNSYGPGEMPGPYRNVIPNFLAAALRGEPLRITGTGEETRAFTFVEDVVDAIIQAAERDTTRGAIVNIGASDETPIALLADTIIRLTRSGSRKEFLPRRSWDHVLRRRPSTAKAERLLGWRATTSLEDGLTKYVAWMRQRLEAQ